MESSILEPTSKTGGEPSEKRLLEGLMQSSPIGIALLDHELRYLHVSRALALLDGVPQEQHLGHPLEEMLPLSESTDAVVQKAHEVLLTGEPVLGLELEPRLSARWPGATVKQISNPERSYALEFQIPMAHSHVEGLLDRTGSSINFEGDIQDMTEFVHWCRSLVPAHLRLIFCDEGLNGEVKVTPPMTASDILQAFYASGG